MLSQEVWSRAGYYKQAREGSLDKKHLGMRVLFNLVSQATSILDLGCGEGTRLSLLAGKKIRATGIDISPKAISLAKEKYPYHNFMVGDLEKLPYPDASFDLVYSAFTFEHLDNPEQVIKEALRVLSKRGKLVVIAPNFGAPNRASPAFKGNRLVKMIKGVIGDFNKSGKLGWNKVRPIADSKKYSIDWDTTIEPYLGTLVSYLKKNNAKVLLANSCWGKELPHAGILQRVLRFLGEKNINPFWMWGPHLVVVAEKSTQSKTCILCGNKKYKKLFEIRGAAILKCSRCGLVKTEGLVMTEYENYHRDEDYLKSEFQFRNFFQKRMQIIRKFYHKSGKVLEIGCSIGTFLSLFRDKGWEVWGVEPSKSASIAKKRKLKIINTRFEEAVLPKNYFDLVILNHTLEHFENPVQVLDQVKKILKKGGTVFVDVPNFGGFSAGLLNSLWPYLMPEEHFFQYSQLPLKRIFEKAGFRVIFQGSRSGIWDYGNPLRGLLDELLNFRKSFFKDLIGAVPAFLTTLLDKGSTLTVVGENG